MPGTVKENCYTNTRLSTKHNFATETENTGFAESKLTVSFIRDARCAAAPNRGRRGRHRWHLR